MKPMKLLYCAISHGTDTRECFAVMATRKSGVGKKAGVGGIGVVNICVCPQYFTVYAIHVLVGRLWSQFCP